MYQKEGIIFKKEEYRSFVLGGDIGGTNLRLAVLGVKGKEVHVLICFTFKTANVKDVSESINTILQYAKERYDIEVCDACIAGAGPVEDSRIKLTNANFVIDANEILGKTMLGRVAVINDFMAIGYGINAIRTLDMKTILHGKNHPEPKEKATKAVIGAGTGLGKSIPVYDQKCQAYISVPSEGGHADLPVEEDELKLIKSLKKKQISYEDVLSGKGLENLYSAIKGKKTEYTKEIDKSKNKAVLITKYWERDERCRKTVELFIRFYARCAKNFALDTLSFGGLYIAGGIAAENPDAFDQNFIKEFEKCTKKKDILKKIPLFIITNPRIGLIGAGFVAEFLKEIGERKV